MPSQKQKFKLNWVLDSQGTASAPTTEYVSCLNQQQLDSFKLITSEFLVEGSLMKGIIDCGATRTFILGNGEIMEYIKQQKSHIFKVNINAYTADSKLVKINSAVNVEIRPSQAPSEAAIPIEPLIVNSLQANLLGADLIVGLPLLHQLKGVIDFSQLPITVKWPNVHKSNAKNNKDHINHYSMPHSPTTVASFQSLVGINQHSSAHSTGHLESIISRYGDVFSEKLNGSTINRPPIRIRLYHRRPIAARPRRNTPEEANEIKQHI